jgi:hypothetical protein
MKISRPTKLTRKYIMIDKPSTTHPSSNTSCCRYGRSRTWSGERSPRHVGDEEDRGPHQVDGEGGDRDLPALILETLAEGEDEPEGDEGQHQHDAGGVRPPAPASPKLRGDSAARIVRR